MSGPKLSIIVIAYNMAREIPRTIFSLSKAYQLGLNEEEYEVILIDNGSTTPLDERICRQWIPNLRIEYMPNPTVSPVPAINWGLEMARADLIGVMIDGARMVSPGLLRTALEASCLHERAVIGTLAFHLGPDVQMRSIGEGYNQCVEDNLLKSSGWTEDGYRLFDISVFAGSSAQGWFIVPNETNALFLTKKHWNELGGYDPGFITPGGGLANLDIWARACADPNGFLIMLLGEATFHQVHGGIATNSQESKWEMFHNEYKKLRGHDFHSPNVKSRFYGTLRSVHRKSLINSCDTI